MGPNYTFCALLYGDYPQLARRCIESFVGLTLLPNVELRIGMNDCSVTTQDYVQDLIRLDAVKPQHIYDIGGNIHKYPRMRQMFYDPQSPLRSDYIVWFDDDAILTAVDKPNWLRTLGQTMADVDLIGATRFQPLIDQQYLWIRDQPWYRGKPVPQKHVVQFFNGGWWCARTGVLQAVNWPIPELDHRGGDVMLGELCRQMDLRTRDWWRGIKHDFEDRRGFDSKPIGYNYQRPAVDVVKDAVTQPPPVARLPFIDLDV